MQTQTILSFSLRIDAVDPLSVVKTNVENALDCQLRGGSYADVSAFVGELLGMRIGLLPWRGIDGKATYQLHGGPDLKELHTRDWQEIRIDQAILDLLRERKAGIWRIPSPEELRAEGNYHGEDM
ncbi:MAG: hypothetical protein KDE31_33600 [Caldilineaceae bacterium]|nr:hypothetical protein [Caldilineaceae bacterium]MCB0189270.1 hypothetical protein [Caldilineaceae bacterium]